MGAFVGLVPLLAPLLPLLAPQLDGPAAVVVRLVSASGGIEGHALGRETHHVRMSLTNEGATDVAPSPLVFRFVPRREGVAFPCAEARGEDRWPRVLAPRESFEIARDVTCETPLPGRYDVDIRARAEGAAAASEVSIAKTSLVVAPSKNGAVPLPWTQGLWAMATAPPEMRPGDPLLNVALALVNGSKATRELDGAKALVTVRRRTSKEAACPPRVVDITRVTEIQPGQTKGVIVPIACNWSVEGIYDIDVTALHGNDRVRVASLGVLVGFIPIPPQALLFEYFPTGWPQDR